MFGGTWARDPMQMDLPSSEGKGAEATLTTPVRKIDKT